MRLINSLLCFPLISLRLCQGPVGEGGGVLLGPGSAVRTGEPQPSPAPPPPAGLLQGYRYLGKVVQKTRLPRSRGTASSKKRRAPNFIRVRKSHTTGSQRRAARAEGGGAALGVGKRRFWSENLEEERERKERSRGSGESPCASLGWHRSIPGVLRGGRGLFPFSGSIPFLWRDQELSANPYTFGADWLSPEGV